MSRNNEGFDDYSFDIGQYNQGNANDGSFEDGDHLQMPHNLNDEIENERIRAREAKRLQRHTRSHFVQNNIETDKSSSINKPEQRPPKLHKHGEKSKSKSKSNFPSPWVLYSFLVTFWAPKSLLRYMNLHTGESQQAWREKMALVSIVLILCGVVGFMTFGLQQILCKNTKRTLNTKLSDYDVVVNGAAYDVSEFIHPAALPNFSEPSNILYPPTSAGKMDLSLLFQNPNSICKKVLKYDDGFANSDGNVVNVFPCRPVQMGQMTPPDSQDTPSACHNTDVARDTLSSLVSNPVSYDFDEVAKNKGYVIYNGAILDLNRVSWLLPQVHVPDEFMVFVNQSFGGQDITLDIVRTNKDIGKCMQDLFIIGYLDTTTPGCIASDIILYVSLIVILGAVFSKFFMAVYFGWFMSRRLGRIYDETPEQRKERLERIENWANVNNHYGKEKIIKKYSVNYPSNYQRRKSKFNQNRYNQYAPNEIYGQQSNRKIGSKLYPPVPPNQKLITDSQTDSSVQNDAIGANNWDDIYNQSAGPLNVPIGPDFESDGIAYTFLLVTCYSEGAHGIRTTLDSLVSTDYPDSHKCLFVVCDGLIKGEGESLTTPDICLSMMDGFVIPPDRVHAFSYVSIATGSKRHNMAKLYAGYYSPSEDSPDELKSRRVPMVLIVKCGTPEEQNDKKVGNRGKRDSQVVLMSFLQRVTFDERMTRLEYELFNAIWNVTGVTPDHFEIVLMVDADTKVYPDSLGIMVAVMVNDPMVMGLCGETKIANKRDSFTSMIQVFEYYISHHLSKAFESVFGGVTCLPGCFCMYRIKAPKGNMGFYAPVLANPDVVENYSENIVDTLHKKNLLLLGEDRYLSNLMLRAFPKRKMMFVPSAVCKTIVPNTFKVLLSQRRRWINSTVHNLMELVLVNDLCGTFCFSMQFIIFMELVGTLVLPAAIVFTLYLIIISFIVSPVPVLPLILLSIILGLPAVLIGLTSRKLVYVGWMLIYLFALPIWNFVLPVYSYWHFDDFSWGETRKVENETKGDAGHGDSSGEFDSSNIIMKRWCDFESEKRKYAELIMATNPELQNKGSDGIINDSDQRPLRNTASYYHTPNRISALYKFAATSNDPEANAVYENIQQLGYHVPTSKPDSLSNYGSSYGSGRRGIRSLVPSSSNISSLNNGNSYLNRNTDMQAVNRQSPKLIGDSSFNDSLVPYSHGTVSTTNPNIGYNDNNFVSSFPNNYKNSAESSILNIGSENSDEPGDTYELKKKK
ncbi:Chitin synthase D [Smittium mucronatum]|uniref:chitin synthase n=1 Tax=Smittium mucronatum TaxID=133383 RepID=A0A1R0H507_9FUNG|nr:Chitin synthase D [Smittium mucronatum]